MACMFVSNDMVLGVGDCTNENAMLYIMKAINNYCMLKDNLVYMVGGGVEG